MLKRLVLSFSLIASLIASSVYAQPTIDARNAPLEITDGTTSTFPYKLTVSSGTLTDNGDGTATLTTGGGGGGAAGSDVTNRVPYFGATNSVNLASYDLSANRLFASTSVISAGDATSRVLWIKDTPDTLKAFINPFGNPQLQSISNPIIIGGNLYGTDLYVQGGMGNAVDLAIGRSVPEFQLGVAQDPNNYFVGAVGGDAIIRNYNTDKNILIGFKDQPAQMTLTPNSLDLRTNLTSTGSIIATQEATASIVDATISASTPILNLTNYIDLLGVVNPPAPSAGHARFHASTTQGFTRFEQDNEATTNLILGRDNVFIAKNTTVSTINAMQAVYVTGSTGNIPNIGLAKSDSLTTLPAVGVALDNITAGSFGQVMKLGVINNVDTSAFSAGNQLWVSPNVAGGFVSVRPSYPSYVQRVGSVLVSGVGNGSLLITIAPFIGMQESGTNAATFAVTSLQASNTATSAVFSASTSTGNYYLPYYFGASGQVPTLQTNGTMLFQTPTATGGSGYSTIQDEGIALTQRTTMNFTGAGVTASDSGGVTVVNIPAAANASSSGSIVAVFDGGGSAIATASTIWVRLPYACTLTEWELTSYATAVNLRIDAWKSTYPTFNTATGPSITGNQTPLLTNQLKNQNTNLSAWSTTVNNKDYIFFKVLNNSGVLTNDYSTYAVLTLSYTK